MMFVKIHDQILSSSIMESDVETRYVWMCLLVLCDSEGFIDMTIPSIARRVNISIEAVTKAIKEFCSPDPHSRTHTEDGRRLTPIRESFGWQIVNYTHYRQIKSEEERREQNRVAQQKHRVTKKNKHPSASVSKRKQVSAKSAYLEAEAEAEAYKPLLKFADSFERFWSVYPKKKSKGQAEKAFKALKVDEQLLATMVATIERAKKSPEWLKDNGQFIPYPATWLRAKGWEDEFKTVQPRLPQQDKTTAEISNMTPEEIERNRKAVLAMIKSASAKKGLESEA